MNISHLSLVEAITFIGILQFILIILCIIILYAIKIVLILNDKYLERKIQIIKPLLQKIDQSPEKITRSMITTLKNSLQQLLNLIEDNDPLYHREKVIKVLTEHVFKPKARILATKRNWYKKYLAIACFNYGVDEQDEKYLINLVHDPILLVSLNAARVIFKFPSHRTLNALIDAFSRGRHLQQNSFVDIIAVKNSQLKKIKKYIIERIRNEPDQYIKAFCYRILTLLPSHDEANAWIQNDLQTNNIELKIAILYFLAKSNFHDFIQNISESANDQRWEVRAVASKLLGQMGDEQFLPLLENNLYDQEWWVRINAANALLNFGKKGVDVLESVTKERDRFAYETAQMVLIESDKREPHAK